MGGALILLLVILGTNLILVILFCTKVVDAGKGKPYPNRHHRLL